MEMKDEIRLNATPEVIWLALNNPEVLKACIPGCESFEQSADNEFAATVVVKVGPIKAKFNSKVTLTEIVAPVSYKLVGEGQGGVAGFAKSYISVELVEQDDSTTLLRYGAVASIGGKIAQLGSRMIDSTANKLAAQFFSNFDEMVCPKSQTAMS